MVFRTPRGRQLKTAVTFVTYCEVQEESSNVDFRLTSAFYIHEFNSQFYNTKNTRMRRCLAHINRLREIRPILL